MNKHYKASASIIFIYGKYAFIFNAGNTGIVIRKENGKYKRATPDKSYVNLNNMRVSMNAFGDFRNTSSETLLTKRFKMNENLKFIFLSSGFLFNLEKRDIKNMDQISAKIALLKEEVLKLEQELMTLTIDYEAT